MKKLICIITVACLAFSTTLNCFAVGEAESKSTFYYGDNIEVVVPGNDISDEKKQLIADAVANADKADEVAPCGILCLFGHSLATKTVTLTSHNVYTTTPKCVVETYEVEYCTRSSCEYTVETLISSSRTNFCHG